MKFTKEERRTIKSNADSICGYIERLGWTFPKEFDAASLVGLKAGLYIVETLSDKCSDDAIAACLEIEGIHEAYMARQCAVESA